MIGNLTPFLTLMGSEEVRAETAKEFDDPNWQCQFVVATAMCLPCVPDTDLPGGYVAEGACVFYVASAPAGPEGKTTHVLYEPWVFKVDLGGSANYVFERLGDPSTRTHADDSGPFSAELMACLERSLWLPLRSAQSVWS